MISPGVISIVRTVVEGDLHLVLRKKNDSLELLLGNVVLLSSAALETERTFGRLAKDAMHAAPKPRVIIGGLGFGATLRGVLEVAPPDAEVIVAEKLETVIDVAKREAAPLVDGALEDPRVTVERADVADVIASASHCAAVLLDVDNGPEWASFRTNARLYGDGALMRARHALRPSGIYAVWSGYPADPFLVRLRRAGFSPELVPLEERGVVRARAYVGRI